MIRRGQTAALLAGILCGGLAAATGALGQEPSAAPAARPWTDPDGKPLPFATDEALLDFLRTADVKTEKQITSGGITFPYKLLIEKDGVRSDAIFRDIDEEKLVAQLARGKSELYFRDSYIFEPAAYELALMLGLDSVPPATLRRVHNKKGSIQIWVENAMTDMKRAKENIKPPDEQQWNKQLQVMNVFDALIYNTDRNRGNILITPDWKLWMIDHGRAFRRHPTLQTPDALKQCERGFYQHLKALDEAQVRARLKEYLTSNELDALWKRRALILDHFAKRIAEQGEDQVLYDYVPKPVPAPTAVP